MLAVSSHEWLIWLDCDALIVKQEERFETLLNALNVSSRHDMVIAKDIGASPFNTGVMFIRRSEWSTGTISRALRLAKDVEIRDHPWWEQRALHVLYDENNHDEREKMLLVEDRWRMNAFESLHEERDGTFIWHRPNCRRQPECDAVYRKKFCDVHAVFCSKMGRTWRR